jgi:RluA family pseudouridine synthase
LHSVDKSLNAEEINSRLEKQIQKLREKDATSRLLNKEDLNTIYEDEHIVVVDKPAGVLCVPNKENHSSLAQAVFDAYGSESGRADKMVVHRLGMDTSGLVVFARTEEALRGMNTLFRTRKVTRSYEALVCGTIEDSEGTINLPLMRDYEFPPYMRVSTDEHQRALSGLDPDDVGKKLLERPKESLTKYEVVGKEELEGNAVTRVKLTSVSGRTHQLNVHCAAIGHPIVGDKVYGINGEAAANGGLAEGTLSSRASTEAQESIASAIGDKSMCVHANTISFEHPVTGEKLSFSSDAPF